MSYEDGFEHIEIEEDLISEAQRIVIKGFMLEGQFNFRDRLIKTLESEISTYLDEVDGQPNIEWIDGVRYCIHIIKNLKVEEE